MSKNIKKMSHFIPWRLGIGKLFYRVRHKRQAKDNIFFPLSNPVKSVLWIMIETILFENNFLW